MASFEYVARQADGKATKGVIDAANEEAVADRLLARGISPISIEETAAKNDLISMELSDFFQTKKVIIAFI